MRLQRTWDPADPYRTDNPNPFWRGPLDPDDGPERPRKRHDPDVPGVDAKGVSPQPRKRPRYRQ